MYVPDQYEGRLGFESYDIAIVVVSGYININNMVLPACIDWLQQHTVRDGTLGMVCDPMCIRVNISVVDLILIS